MPPDDADEEELAKWNYAKNLEGQIKALKAECKETIMPVKDLMQINTSDQNPAVVVGLKPEDSWELSPPYIERCAATLKSYCAYVTIGHIQL